MAEPKQITTEQMRKLLEKETGMSAATRRVLVTGQSTFVDDKGQAYCAPLTHVDTSPTHQRGAREC